MPDGTFITAETALADIKDFGTPMGFFSITDSVSATFEKPTIDKIEVTGSTATVSGKLTGPAGSVQYKFGFEALSTTSLRFVISADRSNASNINRITLQAASVAKGFQLVMNFLVMPMFFLSGALLCCTAKCAGG